MSANENSIKVLHVEDSKSEAFLIKMLLKNAKPEKFTLLHVETLETAKSALQENTFDIILLDLSLPDAHGIDLLHAIEKHAPSLPIVVITGEEGMAFGLEVMREGAQSCLIKGKFKPQTLIDAIRDAIREKAAAIAQPNP